MDHLASAGQVKPMLLLTAEGFREILTYQHCFWGGHVGAYVILFRIFLYSTYLKIKAVPTRAPDINFAFRPEDNHRLIVHECSGLEPGGAQGLRAILDFISNRTDPSTATPERLHAIW